MRPDVLVGVFRDRNNSFTVENYFRGVAYYEHVQSLSGWGWVEFLTKDLWNFIDNDFTALPSRKDF